MDFIERLFGISPDGGSGALELLLFVMPIVVLTILLGSAVVRWRRNAFK